MSVASASAATATRVLGFSLVANATENGTSQQHNGEEDDAVSGSRHAEEEGDEEEGDDHGPPTGDEKEEEPEETSAAGDKLQRMTQLRDRVVLYLRCVDVHIAKKGDDFMDYSFIPPSQHMPEVLKCLGRARVSPAVGALRRNPLFTAMVDGRIMLKQGRKMRDIFARYSISRAPVATHNCENFASDHKRTAPTPTPAPAPAAVSSPPASKKQRILAKEWDYPRTIAAARRCVEQNDTFCKQLLGMVEQANDRIVLLEADNNRLNAELRKHRLTEQKVRAFVSSMQGDHEDEDGATS